MCTWRKSVELNAYDLFTFPYMYDISIKSSKIVLLYLLPSFLLLLHSTYHHKTNYVLFCFICLNHWNVSFIKRESIFNFFFFLVQASLLFDQVLVYSRHSCMYIK